MIGLCGWWYDHHPIPKLSLVGQHFTPMGSKWGIPTEIFIYKYKLTCLHDTIFSLENDYKLISKFIDMINVIVTFNSTIVCKNYLFERILFNECNSSDVV